MRMSVAAAAAALIGLSVAPAGAGGGCCYGGYGYGYGYGRYVAEIDYTYDAPPPVVYRLVPVATAQPVLLVNQGPTFVPTVMNYITPTVTYEEPRVFPYGASGYGSRYAYRRHHHRHYHGHRQMPMPGYK